MSDHTESKEDSIACPGCDESFSSGSLLASHFACQHTKPSDTAEEPKKLGASPLNEEPSDEPFKAAICPPRSNLCYRSFMNVRGLRAHKWQKHRRTRGRPAVGSDRANKPFPCSRCEKRYSSQGPPRPVKPHVAEGPLLPHRPSETTTKFLFKCHKCGKAFPSEAQLDAHKEAARTRPHCCALCCRGYWTESQLQQHLAWHDEVRRRLPTELRYRLSASVVSGPSPELQDPAHNSGRRDSVSLVKEPAATANTQAPKNHRCHQCGKTFLSPRALEQHQAVHKREEPYHCSLCPQTFGDIRDLIDHHQECLGDKELMDTCSSASRDDVQEKRAFWCQLCARGFVSSEALDKHLLGHNKKHRCDICFKFFRVPAELHCHYNVHTGAQPYSCGFCHKTFLQMSNLITHRKKHLEVVEDGEDVSLGKKAPQLCGKRFSMPKALQKHLEAHEKEDTEGTADLANSTTNTKKKRNKGRYDSVSRLILKSMG
uniref:C2H2-type domain-containing protein n=1 Tax=Electrophorus electricus TaxID=8005 RepID=A0A4W4GD81_ELEEL